MTGTTTPKNDETPRPEAGGAGKREYVALALHKKEPQVNVAHIGADSTPWVLVAQSPARRHHAT